MSYKGYRREQEKNLKDAIGKDLYNILDMFANSDQGLDYVKGNYPYGMDAKAKGSTKVQLHGISKDGLLSGPCKKNEKPVAGNNP